LLDTSSEPRGENQKIARKTGISAKTCSAHNKKGGRCRRQAMLGSNVCFHGGKAAQVMAAARRRLELAAITPERTLLEIARIAVADIAGFFNDDGSVKKPSECRSRRRWVSWPSVSSESPEWPFAVTFTPEPVFRTKPERPPTLKLARRTPAWPGETPRPPADTSAAVSKKPPRKVPSVTRQTKCFILAEFQTNIQLFV